MTKYKVLENIYLEFLGDSDFEREVIEPPASLIIEDGSITVIYDNNLSRSSVSPASDISILLLQKKIVKCQ